MAIISVLMVGLTAQHAAAQATTRPAFTPAGKPTLIGMVHINVASLRNELPALVKKLQPLAPPAVGAKIPALTKMLDKIEAIDVFVLIAGRRPMPVAAISGKAAPQDIADILSMFIGAKIPPRKLSEGRYAIGPIETVIVGKRMFVAPRGVLGKEMLNLIITGEKKLLTGVLAKVNRKAHVWGGIEGMDKLDRSAPASGAGSVSLDKKFSGVIELVFASVKRAERMEKGLARSKVFIGKSYNVKRTGATVTIKLNASAEQLMASIMRARKLAKRNIAAANLRGIGMAIEFYKVENNDTAPPTLAKLVEAKYISAKMLLSPSSGRKTMATDAKGIPAEPGDYEYIVLPDHAPGGLVRAYEKPRINGGEGACVLHASSAVGWLTLQELKEYLAETHKWLAEHRDGRQPRLPVRRRRR